MRSPSTLTRTIQINTAKTVSSQQKGHQHSNTELRLGHPFSPLVPAAFLLSPSLSPLPSPFFLAANIQKKQAFTLLAQNVKLVSAISIIHHTIMQHDLPKDQQLCFRDST